MPGRGWVAILANAGVASHDPQVAGGARVHTTICDLLNAAAKLALIAAFLTELGVVLANIATRQFVGTSLVWSDELARLALSTMAFVGGAVAYRARHHSIISVALARLPVRLRAISLSMADVLVLVISVVTGLASMHLVSVGWAQATPILQLPGSLVVLPLTVSMALIAIYAVEHLCRGSLLDAVVCLAVVLALIGIGGSSRELWQPWIEDDTATWVTLSLFFVSIVGGLPVGFALLLATAIYLWFTDAAPMVELPHNMVAGTANFVLLALPFFIFAGLIMERGGISLRLVRFVHALVGHFRGGLLQVMVISMYLVSGLSGSKSADVAAVGTTMREMLKREGYGPDQCAAVLAASAAMGETVPPSIAMLVLGSITSLSMAALFIGGVIPAAVIAVCLMALIHVRARWSHAARVPRASSSRMVHDAARAVLPLLMPVCLFAGILSGVATPTEIAALAIVYGGVLAAFVYRAMRPRSFAVTLVESATMAGMILFILAAAQSFSWVLTVAYVPQRLVELLHSLGDSGPLFMIGSIILLIVSGSLLEGLPALNILAPLLLPIAQKMGFSQLHFGIVLLIAMGIGAFMPPTGVGFYVCCAVARSDIESASRAMAPYLVCLVVGLLIVAFVPVLTVYLPRALGFPG
jgi:tripartite ATP-independent transporter DctM subunit